MKENLYAIILAGGNGERFWPLSTPAKPKQFLDLFGGKPLIRHAADRVAALVPPERLFVITAERFVGLTRAALPHVPPENVVGEPCRRDTAAAAATACGIVLKRGGPEAVGCLLTADHLIAPEKVFCDVLADCADAAAAEEAIVTIGIPPARPETAYGYIACGGPAALPVARHGTRLDTVRRFVEKPDAATAAAYVASGEYLWNAGMFIWRAGVLRDAFRKGAPDIAPLVDAVARAPDVPAALRAAYPPLRAISVDFAVMERAERMLVASRAFTWDDVGSWSALAHHFPADAEGNTRLGRAFLQNVSGTTVVNAGDDGHVLAVAGLADAVVVHTPGATLVCSKAEADRLKPLVRNILENTNKDT